jgi:CXXX repeat radical SAM target protein
MEEKKQNEELQSRREFFKQAAKKALPVLGAIALMSSPIIAQAAEKDPMGCTGTCYGACRNACKGCSTTCEGSCKHSCTGCSTTCYGGCKNYNK